MDDAAEWTSFGAKDLGLVAVDELDGDVTFRPIIGWLVDGGAPRSRYRPVVLDNSWPADADSLPGFKLTVPIGMDERATKTVLAKQGAHAAGRPRRPDGQETS